ncbi:MAG: hypothetical protein OHK0053_15340 [Microscillaceae bacterium]
MSKTEQQQKGWSLDSLLLGANALEKALVRRSQVFAEAFTPAPVSWSMVQAELKPGQAAVEIKRLLIDLYQPGKVETDTVYLALLLTPETRQNPLLVLIEEGGRLETGYLDQYYRALLTRQNDPQSYRRYWQAIQAALQNNSSVPVREVFVSLDGVYHELALEAILNPQTGRYLSQEIQLIRLGSTRQLIEKASPPLPGQSPTAFLLGRPTYDLSKDAHSAALEKLALERDGQSRSITQNLVLDSFVDLPETELEINEISQHLAAQGWQIIQKLGAEALEECLTLTQDSVQLLHLATHGFFSLPDDASGVSLELAALLNSGLALAGANSLRKANLDDRSEDGILTALEVSNLALDQVRLVTLSACQTGLGRIVNGEGVYGLQRAFKVAGAKAILMSLWKVDDRATHLLMQHFYKEYLQHGEPRRALSAAQQALRAYSENGFSPYTAPFYWGGFVVAE